MCRDTHTHTQPLLLAGNPGLCPRQVMDFSPWEEELDNSPDTKRQRSGGCPGRGSLSRKRHRVKASLPLHLKSRCFIQNCKLSAIKKTKMWFSGRDLLYMHIDIILDKAMWRKVKYILFPNCLHPAIWKQKASLFSETQKSNGQLLIYKPTPGRTAPFARVRKLISSRQAIAFIRK